MGGNCSLPHFADVKQKHLPKGTCLGGSALDWNPGSLLPGATWGHRPPQNWEAGSGVGLKGSFGDQGPEILLRLRPCGGGGKR